MTPTCEDTSDDAEPDAWWQRLHRRLMPDYNRKAATYWWLTVLLGAAVLGQVLRTLLALPPATLAEVAAGVAIAMLAGLFPVRIPRSKNSFAAGEIFIFLLLLLHGPAAATLAAAGEGLIGSWRTTKRWTSRLASPAMGSIAMFSAGSLLYAGIEAMQAQGIYSAGLLLLGAMLCAVLDFTLNTSLVTALPYLKRNQWPAPRELFASFGWVGITFVASASVACLLFLVVQQSGRGVLLVAAPILAMMLATLHYFFRQQEADEVVRKNALEAAEREAELVARHVRELEASEAKLQHIAFHDSLTGLPNRRRFQEHLTQMLERVHAEPQRKFGLMFLDFDRFKLINDSLGHAIGDEFLIAVARRIQHHMRPQDVVARLGGDEFVTRSRSPSGCWRCCASRCRFRATTSSPVPASASPSAARSTRRRPTCCATPTPRCTRPRPAARRAMPSSTARCTPKWRTACGSKANCAMRWRAASCRWRTSRCSSSPPAASPVSRRWRAGTTPSSAPSTRRCSSRWPKTPA
jgi:GGDEF domain-containing protein